MIEFYSFIRGIYILTAWEFIPGSWEARIWSCWLPLTSSWWTIWINFQDMLQEQIWFRIMILALKTGLLCCWAKGAAVWRVQCTSQYIWHVERLRNWFYPAWSLDQYSLVRVRFKPRPRLVWSDVATCLFVRGASFFAHYMTIIYRLQK